MNFALFLADNGLKQKDIAKYLGISEPSVSSYASGKAKPSKANLQKLLDNPNWDTSALLQESPDEVFNDVTVQVLKMRIKELEKQNKEYWEVIKTLTSKINV